MNRRMAVLVAYPVGAFVLGAVTATAQGFGFGQREWFGAAAGGPALGVVVGLLGTAVGRGGLPQAMFWSSAATLAITALGAECAMCFFVP